jgi:hypothetical protein
MGVPVDPLRRVVAGDEVAAIELVRALSARVVDPAALALQPVGVHVGSRSSQHGARASRGSAST